MSAAAAVAAAACATSAVLAWRLSRCLRELAAARERLGWFAGESREARHSLRTPLTAMIGFATLLRDRSDRLSPEKREQYLRMLLEESERLSRLVDALLKPSDGLARDRDTV